MLLCSTDTQSYAMHIRMLYVVHRAMENCLEWHCVYTVTPKWMKWIASLNRLCMHTIKCRCTSTKQFKSVQQWSAKTIGFVWNFYKIQPHAPDSNQHYIAWSTAFEQICSTQMAMVNDGQPLSLSTSSFCSLVRATSLPLSATTWCDSYYVLLHWNWTELK